MTCREVERFWALRLDSARLGSPSAMADAPPRELEEHLGRCPRCQMRSAGMPALIRAIGALGPPPRPPDDLAARILAAVEADRAPATPPMRRGLRPATPAFRRAAVAAAVLLSLAVLRAMLPDRAPAPGPPALGPGLGPIASERPRPLAEAVAEAAEATVAIARRTSGPAARLGREVLIAGTGAGIETPGPDLLPDDRAADRVVRSIGDRLEAGVRPLSEPTRSAFSFLLPSFPAADDPSPPERGA